MSAPSNTSGPGGSVRDSSEGKATPESPTRSQSICGNAESPPTDVLPQDEQLGVRVQLWLDDVVVTDSPVASNDSPQDGSFLFPPHLVPNRRPPRPLIRSLSPLSIQMLNFEQGPIAPNDSQSSPQTWDSTGQIDDSSEDPAGHSALGLRMSPASTASRHPSPILHPGQQLLGRAIRSLGMYRSARFSLPPPRSTV